ncbi:MAG: phage antirepressor KilAC domain-containing protein [Bdellovibrionaceae bacterium]|nr:phage antirepressor KilAC domain-containing protein [Pseudobdellovibrionaceae bacterium]
MKFEIDDLQEKFVLDAINFYLAFSRSKDSLSLSEAGSLIKSQYNLNLGRNNLSKFLRNKGVFTSGTEPRSEYLDREYFERILVKVNDNMHKPKILITPKGFQWLIKEYIEPEVKRRGGNNEKAG